jgi:xylose isomerase
MQSMGATYTAEMVRAQIDATEKLGIDSWAMWDPRNDYTDSAYLVQ